MWVYKARIKKLITAASPSFIYFYKQMNLAKLKLKYGCVITLSSPVLK